MDITKDYESFIPGSSPGNKAKVNANNDYIGCMNNIIIDFVTTIFNQG